MKLRKVLIYIVTLMMLTTAIFAVAGCKKTDDRTDFQKVSEYAANTATAVKVTQTLLQKEGDSLVSSREVVYNIHQNGTVSGTQSVKTLNEDFLATEEYTQVDSTFSLTSEQAVGSVPLSVTLDQSMINGGYTFTNGVLSFAVKASEIAEYLGLTETEAQGISNLQVVVTTLNEAVTNVKVSYLSANGFNVEITTVFDY